MSDYRIIYSDELYHYGVPGMRWGHRKQQLMNIGRGTKRVAGQIKDDAKSRYNHLSSKNKARVKIAARVGLAVFTPIGIGTQIIAHAGNKYAKKHPEKIKSGKKKLQNVKNATMSQVKKYTDVYKQGANSQKNDRVIQDR